MADTTQDEIYRRFLEVSQQQAEDLTQARQSLTDLIVQADQVRQDMAQQYVRSATGSSASSSPGGASGSGGGSSSGGVLSTVLDVFKNGLALSPLVRGIMSLFGGGGSSSAAPPLVKYALPPAIDFQAAEVGGRVTNLDYDASGLARSYGASQANAEADLAGIEVQSGEADAVSGTRWPTLEQEFMNSAVQFSTPAAQDAGSAVQWATAAPPVAATVPAVSSNGGDASRQASQPPQITVNVQAMDARSFMDRSNEIALAVREAMLNLNAINDVVNDL